MQNLRSARQLVRFVLAMFVLALGVAVASPVFRPGSLNVVCSGSGVFKIVDTGQADQGGDAGSSLTHRLDCPLCLHLTTPPVQVSLPDYAGIATAAEALPDLPAVPFVSRSSAALPPRGPPSRI